MTKMVKEAETVDLGKIAQKEGSNAAWNTGNLSLLHPETIFSLSANGKMLPEKLKKPYYKASLAVLIMLSLLSAEERKNVLKDQKSLRAFIEASPHFGFLASGIELRAGRTNFDIDGFISTLKEYQQIHKSA